MANIALQGGKVILKDGKASCACCDPCPQFSNLCVNGLPLFGPTYSENNGGVCTWQTDSTQCLDNIFTCYGLSYYFTFPDPSVGCVGSGWIIFFFADFGGSPAVAGAYKCGNDPYGTYTLFPGSPGQAPTISSCS
jgi:hypothetical protein